MSAMIQHNNIFSNYKKSEVETSSESAESFFLHPNQI